MSSLRDNRPGAARPSPYREEILAWDPIDLHIGRRVRLRRSVLAMPPEELAGALRVTREQVALFEAGELPVPAARLWDLAKVLDVPLEYFFQED